MEAQNALWKMLEGENLTSLRAQYDWRTDKFQFESMKEWGPKTDWSDENRKGLLKRVKKFGMSETREIARKYNLDDYLDEVLYLIRTGRHERVAWYYEAGMEACCVMAVHKTCAGLSLGNLRRMGGKGELELLTDTLNMARIMTFRCASGQIPFGGAHMAFQSSRADKSGVMNFLNFLIDRERTMWGVGYGFSEEDAKSLEAISSRAIQGDALASNFHQCSTAGIRMAIEEALLARYGSAKVEGKLVAIQGLGKIGALLAEQLLEAGADLIVCDGNPATVENFMKNHQARAKSIEVMNPTEIRMQMGHVFCPCGEAQERSLTRDAIRAINYPILVGGAAQLLQASTQAEEITLSSRLLKKGILHIPDWISNVGASMYAVSLIQGEKSPDVLPILENIEGHVRLRLRDILRKSGDEGISPLEQAYRIFEPIVYAAEKSGSDEKSGADEKSGDDEKSGADDRSA